MICRANTVSLVSAAIPWWWFTGGDRSHRALCKFISVNLVVIGALLLIIGIIRNISAGWYGIPMVIIGCMLLWISGRLKPR